MVVLRQSYKRLGDVEPLKKYEGVKDFCVSTIVALHVGNRASHSSEIMLFYCLCFSKEISRQPEQEPCRVILLLFLVNSSCLLFPFVNLKVLIQTKELQSQQL